MESASRDFSAGWADGYSRKAPDWTTWARHSLRPAARLARGLARAIYRLYVPAW